MKILERNQERLKLKSDLNGSISIFMLLALGALVATIGFAIIILAVNLFGDSPKDLADAFELSSEQLTIFMLLAMTAFGALVTAAFMPLTTEYEIERSSMLFKVKTSYFLVILNEIQEISLRDIKRIETQKLGGQGQINLVLEDRSVNISGDVELAEDRAVEITDSIAQFIRNR